jgi:hypothetical protein
MVIDCRERFLFLSQLMCSIVCLKITYGVWRSNIDVDLAAKCSDSLFRLSFTPNLSYAADDLLLIGSLSKGIVIPAKYPHVGAAFPLYFEETSLPKSVHFISFASLSRCLIGMFRSNSSHSSISPFRTSHRRSAQLWWLSGRWNLRCPHLRKILIHGARAAVLRIKRDRAPIGAWLDQLDARAHKNVVIVAMANKIARIAWAVLSSGNEYRPEAVPA